MNQTQSQAHPGGTRHAPPGLALPLLARHAENVLWLGRYLERIETQARLIGVTRTVAQDAREEPWRAVLRINDDEGAFRARHGAPNGEGVARFYLLDRDNPSSIVNAMAQVRENARTLRALISSEAWAQINVFHGRIQSLTEADIAPHNLAATCLMLRDGVQAHTGISEGTFYRDQGWSFYQIGRHLERADGMTRLVDHAYAALLPPAVPVAGQAVAITAWDALLRAADGYHAFRRVRRHGVHRHGDPAADIAGFLLLDGGFPRSVSLNLSQLSWHLDLLRTGYGLAGGKAAAERLHDLRGLLAGLSAPALLQGGLSPFLDRTQRELAAFQNEVTAGLFAPAG